MSTNPAERLRGGIAALLTLVLVSGCGLIHHDDPPLRVVPTDVAAELQHVLDARANALRHGNERAFLATINRADRTLTSRERRYFTNIGQLPVSQVSYELDRASMIDTGEGVWAVVRRHLQLTPYDARPVITPDRMRFVVVEGRFVIANDQDHDWQEANGIAVPPWDAMRVQVRSVAGVLGIFDDHSVADADPILADVQRGLDDHVPVWLSEGLAEWVSVQPIPVSQRVISEEALDEARSGITAMPGGDGFNGPHSGANYGISWWACDWIVATFR